MSANGKFPPALSSSDAEAVENRNVDAGDIACARRITIGVLTRSQEQLIESWRSDAGNKGEAMLEILRQVENYRKHCELSIGFAKTAAARLLYTGQLVFPPDNPKTKKTRKTREVAA